MGTDVFRSVGDGDGGERDARVSKDGGSGRGKTRASGLREILVRKGGLRTLRYMFKDRRALLAWGT